MDTIDGPVMVVAGPGAGKTQILTLRVANILRQTDTPPDAILALTFTEAGVSAMRSRLVSIMAAAAYRINIFTFHGFCNEVINRFSSRFKELIGSRPVSALEQIDVMKKSFDSVPVKILATPRSPYYYVKKVLNAISLLKREAISPSDLQERLNSELEVIISAPDYKHDSGSRKGKIRSKYFKQEEEIAKNRELALLYKRYEVLLAKEKLYDFDDMILSVISKLARDENLRLILEEEYQYILADEHQDANGAQNLVLEFLSSFHDSPNLFIVGDEKQAIYRFQGASLENFLYFKKRFPQVKLITLEENYRSSQIILDAAHGLMANNDKKLLAKNGYKNEKISIIEYENLNHEARALASKIKKLVASGALPEDIVIFTRTNAELGFYARALSRAGLPVSVRAQADVLDDIHIEKLLTLIRAVANVGEDEWLVRALHLSFFDISELDIYKVIEAAHKQRVSLWGFLQNLEKTKFFKLANPGQITKVLNLLASWAKLGANVPPSELVSKIIFESGLLAEMISLPNASDKLAMVSSLLSFLGDFLKNKRNARLGDLPAVLDDLDEFDILDVNTKGCADGRVKMMTAHKGKGLEFDYVFIVGFLEGNWSGGRSRSDFKIPGLVSVTKEDEESDDKRLFYVSLTRARRGVSISFSKTRDDGTAVSPSRFLDFLPPKLLHRETNKDNISITVMADDLRPLVSTPPFLDELKSLVKKILSERGLSVTGLNNYLKCPWQYFYRTLLRVPERESPPLMFGNAMHQTLKIFFDSVARGHAVSKNKILRVFENELSKESLSDKELKLFLEEGRAALDGYLKFYGGTFEKNIKNEFALDAFLKIGDFDLRLTGKLDKIEFLKDGGVKVVDYKTGRIKSRNEIEGKTKNSDGDYKRQLIFYNLLLNKFSGGKFRMKSGIIDFILSDKRGRYHREEFFISPDEADDLEETIKRVALKILGLKFWDEGCGKEDCRYCQLREVARRQPRHIV